MAINSDSVSLKISTDAKETNTNLDGIITRLDKTIGLLTKISTSNSFERKNNDIKKTRSTIEGLNTSLSSVNKTLKNIDKNSSWTGLRSLTSHLKELANTSYKWIEASAGYAENLNLLQVAFGETGKEFDRMNESFVNGLSDSFGLDESIMTRQLGYYRQIGNALKIDSEYADMLGKNLLKMQLDMSSLYNLSFERSGEVLQASMAGQTKPIRGATGADITQATLQTDLDRMGIDESISNLSRAEKVLLIYLSIQNQIVASQGDLAKTINSTANQQKIFAEQSARLSRVLGNVLNPAFGQLLQVANGVLMVIVELVEMFASLVGFELPTYETGNDLDWIEDLDTGLGSANTKAKELKKSLRGFDKLNVISTPSSSPNSGGGIDAGGAGIMKDLLAHLNEYDLKMKDMENNATKIRDRIMEWLGFTAELNPLTGEMEWKYQGIKKTLSNVWNSFKGLSASGKVFVALGLVSTFSNLFKFSKKLTGVLGKTTGLSGIINSMITPTKNLFGTLVTGTKSSHSSLKNAITSWREQQGIIDSTTGKVAGFKGVMAGLGTALKGLAIGVTSFAILSDSLEDATEKGLNFANSLGIVAGHLGNIASGATIGSVFGVWGTALGALGGSLVGIATTYQKLPTEITRTTDAINKSTESINEFVDGVNRENEYIDNNLRKNLILVDNHNRLVESLEKIVDQNGKVKDGHEEEVQYILNELSDAYGIEMELQNGVIKNYQKTITEIKKTIKAKEAEFILESQREKYAKALENEARLFDEMAESEKNADKALSNYNKSAKKYNDYLEYSKKNFYNPFKLLKLKESADEAEKAYDKAIKAQDKATKAYKNNITIQNDYSDLNKAVVSGNLEEIEKRTSDYVNSYEKDGKTIIKTEDEILQRRLYNWELTLNEYKKNNSERYNALVKSLADETKAVEEITPEQAKKWAILGQTDKTAFISEFSKLNEDVQQKIINKMYDNGIKISENLQKGISSINPKIKFTSNIEEIVKNLNKSFKKMNANLPDWFQLPTISGYANGGFPEDGWFRASKGELIGQFDDGTSMVANNKQVVAGVREMLKDGMMDALMMANNTNKQNVNVTIVAEDNDMLNGIKFKEKQRDRQYGF